MPEIALIPPVPHLRDFNTTGTCMLLAHLCKNIEYVKYYRERRRLDDYLILDNSAFEMGVAAANMPQLMALGSYIHAQEVVAPDSIMNQHETYGKSLEAVDWMSSHVGQLAWREAGSPRIMIAPQVNPSHESIDDYGDHAFHMLRLWHQGAPFLRGCITLGVSKNMDKLMGGWLMLFHDVVRDLRKEFPIEVHCLGLPKSLTRVKKVVRYEPYIRSLDTALPFVCAAHGVELNGNNEELPKRQENYLERKLLEFGGVEGTEIKGQVELARRNINYLIDAFKPDRSVM